MEAPLFIACRIQLETFLSLVAFFSLPLATMGRDAPGGAYLAAAEHGGSLLLAQEVGSKPVAEDPAHGARRIHLEGLVTTVRPGDWFMLRTANGSYEVALPGGSTYRPGDDLSLEGEPQIQSGGMHLVNADIHLHEAKAPPRPVEITRPADAAHGDYIAVQGRVRDVFLGRNRARLVLALEGGHTSCTAFLEAPLEVMSMKMPRLGALVRVEGPCLRRSMYWWLGSDLTIGSALGTRMEVLAPPPWWTVSRLEQALWWVCGLVVVGGGANARLWWGSTRRARRRNALERSAAVAQERQRIAWEIHDSLRQEIAAARLHLENLKTAARLSPEAVPELASQTQDMLRHCEEEARNCIWDLRAGIGDELSLPGTLQRWLKVRQPTGGECTVEMRAGSEPLGLSPEQSFQILRIVQETVNNAITHALAGTIVVSLRRNAEGVELLVEDDGCGFEIAGRVDREGIHFGLHMLRERAARIRAEIQVRSELNVGTRLRLVLPDAELTRL